MKRVLLVALAACGGGGHHTTDAPPLDATGDTLGTSADAPPNGVTLHVTDGGDPVAERHRDLPRRAGQADRRGRRPMRTEPQQQRCSGGTVTAMLHEGAGPRSPVTFTAVAPGDALVLELAPPGPRWRRRHLTAPDERLADLHDVSVVRRFGLEPRWRRSSSRPRRLRRQRRLRGGRGRQRHRHELPRRDGRRCHRRHDDHGHVRRRPHRRRTPTRTFRLRSPTCRRARPCSATTARCTRPRAPRRWRRPDRGHAARADADATASASALVTTNL